MCYEKLYNYKYTNLKLKMKKNTFACIIPWSGKVNYLPEALFSVFNQKRLFDEVIVVCDTKQIPAGSSDPRVKWILTGGGAGAGGARNLGVQHAESDWVVFLDHDDILTDNYLSSIEKEAVSGVHSLLVKLKYYSDGVVGRLISKNGFHDIPTGSCIRKSSFIQAGGFPSITGGEDIVFFRRIRRIFGDSIKISKVLGLYRIHSESDVSKNRLVQYYSTLLCCQIDDGKLNISWDDAAKLANQMAEGVGVNIDEHSRAAAEVESRANIRISYSLWLARKRIQAILFLAKSFICSPKFFLVKIINKW
jgi:glycosyltransferase involved in cell wall biosynthesis